MFELNSHLHACLPHDSKYQHIFMLAIGERVHPYFEILTSIHPQLSV